VPHYVVAKALALAAEPLMLARPAWWPDWRGETCVIVASGPSAKDADLDRARGRARVVAVNDSWRLAPWADALYAADFAWWRHNRGCPTFGGLKLAGDARAAGEDWGVQAVTVRKADDRPWFDDLGSVGRGGGNSGFQALNLMAQVGCSPIILVGFDMTLDHGVHWHGKHPKALSNPTAERAKAWRRCTDAAAPAFAQRGVRVLNASAISALTAYLKIDLSEALA
jgi:hypothetical protein